MKKRRLFVGLAGVGSLVGVESLSQAGFVTPTTFDPATGVTQSIGVNYTQVQTYTETIGYDSNFDPEPDVYWFKYTSDGKTAVTFDTLGSNFGTYGPSGGSSSGGLVLGETNNSEIAVFSSTGKAVAISSNTVDAKGNWIAQSAFTGNSNDFGPEDLSQLSFKANATTDPQWDVSPSDPNGYTGYAPPGDAIDVQKYYPPDYPTSLNQYHAWSSALSPYVLNNDGTTYQDSSGSLHNEAGWRYYDYGRLGPASTWNQYRVLPAGTYYIAVSSSGVVYNGDTYGEDLLEAPIHYDYTGNEANNGSLPAITQPLGTWQYYDDPTNAPYGTIELNVTQSAATTQYQWLTDGNSNWTNAANWAGPVPGAVGDTANFLATNTAARTVTLDAAESVGHLVFDSANQYTIAGNSTLTLNNGSTPGDVIVDTGSHVISAPVAVGGDTTIITYDSTALSITGGLSIAAGKTLTKDGVGALTLGGVMNNATGSAIYIGEGSATILSDPGANTALTSTAAVTFPASTMAGIRSIHLSSLTISTAGLVNGIVAFSTPTSEANRTVLVTSALTFTGNSSVGWVGQLDLGGNDAVVHNGNLAQIISQVASGYNVSSGGYWNGQGITSSAAAGDSAHLTALAVVPNSLLGLTTFDGQAVSSSDVLIKYTLYGDANLDGVVNGSDYTLIDNGFNRGLTGWLYGDFNYDGKVDGSDYSLIDNTYLQEQGVSPLAIASPVAQVVTEFASTSVPEPLGLTVPVALLFLSKRRRV